MPHIGNISKSESSILKGIGILLIVLHNYFLWIDPVTGVNEFNYSAHRLSNSIDFFIQDPSDIINILFSYLAHLGVQVFIFLSGYGLFKKYNTEKINWGSFMSKRVKKLYPAFLISAILLILLKSLKNFELPSSEMGLQILYKLLFINNFIPGEAMSVVGPWWFYSAIVQLYAVFPLIIFFRKKFGENSILIIGGLAYLAVYLSGLSNYEIFQLPVMSLFIGQLPVFCAGIFIAGRPSINLSNKLLVLALTVFIAGNVTEWIWPLSNMAALVLFLFVLRGFFPENKSGSTVQKFLVYFGEISMYLFACHGFLRSFYYTSAIIIDDSWYVVLMSIVFLGISLLVALAVKKAESIYLWLRDRMIVRT